MQASLPPSLLEALRERIAAEVDQVSYVGGGDINQARLIRSGSEQFFLKYNDLAQAAAMFAAEAKGLSLLGSNGVIAVPAVCSQGQTPDGWAFLLLEYVPSGPRDRSFWEDFGRALATLHRQTAENFGLDHGNFIGSLPQSNREWPNWSGFYREERLQPQLQRALEAGLLEKADLRRFERFYRQLDELCPQEAPALIHGDLWSGNFLSGADRRPWLIDPAAGFAHREMDLAMSRLFGGFDWPFYRAYQEAFPTEPGLEERLPYYQLYYLLVHLNLFGKGYLGSVRDIMLSFGD